MLDTIHCKYEDQNRTTCKCVHSYKCISSIVYSYIVFVDDSCMTLSHLHHTCTCVCYVLYTLYIVGVDCVIVKSGRRICGTGAALANAPLVQDKSYYEIKIQCGG